MNEPKYLTTKEVVEVIKELSPTCKTADGLKLTIEQLESLGAYSTALIDDLIQRVFKGKRFQSKDELRNHLTNT